MTALISIIGASGVGKTTLVHALAKTGKFDTAYEQHEERPFQALFKQETRYALANQMDYLLFRAEQEHRLRASKKIGLLDGGLDLDFHGFTRLFHTRGLLTNNEYDLCRRFYTWTRQLLPLPDLIVHLTASDEIIRQRLAARRRINIASAEDAALLNAFLEEWLATIHPKHLLRLDVSSEGPDYSNSRIEILKRLQQT